MDININDNPIHQPLITEIRKIKNRNQKKQSMLMFKYIQQENQREQNANESIVNIKNRPQHNNLWPFPSTPINNIRVFRNKHTKKMGKNSKSNQKHTWMNSVALAPFPLLCAFSSKILRISLHPQCVLLLLFMCAASPTFPKKKKPSC